MHGRTYPMKLSKYVEKNIIFYIFSRQPNNIFCHRCSNGNNSLEFEDRNPKTLTLKIDSIKCERICRILYVSLMVWVCFLILSKENFNQMPNKNSSISPGVCQDDIAVQLLADNQDFFMGFLSRWVCSAAVVEIG